MQSSQEVLANLAQPIPRQLIKSRTQGGSKIPCLEWHTINRLLDERAPGWNGSAVVSIAGDTVIVAYSLRIPTSEH